MIHSNKKSTRGHNRARISISFGGTGGYATAVASVFLSQVVISTPFRMDWHWHRHRGQAGFLKVGSCHQDEVPQTPVTPVSVEGLASLYNLIKQDAYTLNKTSIQRLERHVQKL